MHIRAILLAGTPIRAQAIPRYFSMAPCQSEAEGIPTTTRTRFLVDSATPTSSPWDTTEGKATHHAFTYFVGRDSSRLFARAEFSEGEGGDLHRLTLYHLSEGRMVRSPYHPRSGPGGLRPGGRDAAAQKFRLIDLRCTLPRQGTTILAEPEPIMDLPGAALEHLGPRLGIGPEDLEESHSPGAHQLLPRARTRLGPPGDKIFRIGRKIRR